MRTKMRSTASIVAASLFLGLLGSVWTTSTAWAAVGKGTVTCTSVAAQVTFKPPLLPQGTAAEKATIKPITIGGCTSNGNPVVVSKASATIKVVGTNSCAAFAANVSSDSLNLVIKWSKLSATTVKFKPGSVSVNGTDSGFAATGGKATGSFKTTSASFTADMSTSSQAQLVSCIGGSGTVSSAQIVSGSATF